MSEQDRLHWDDRYQREEHDDLPGLPAVFAGCHHLIPEHGLAIDLACGRGNAAVWLALRGLDVCRVDVSPVAVRAASELARRNEVSSHCRFVAADLDNGLPDAPAVDVILCHLFWHARLVRAIIERLAPGGLLAIAVLSEVEHGAGSFRAAPGALLDAFRALTVVAANEAAGRAWLLATA